ncbi:AMP-binding protein [Streptomyces sp. NPDC096176]|uniref:AMP-binding protein n=1 Tax=Streptomyces sp. NPDC096176 TaxID=3366079 RepID=UPI0037F4F8B1
MSGGTLVERVRAQAHRTPQAAALVWQGDEISYGALWRRAERERARVADTPGRRPVGVPAVKSPDTIAVVLACLLERRPVLLASATLGKDVTEELYEQAGAVPLPDKPDDRPDATAYDKPYATADDTPGVPPTDRRDTPTLDPAAPALLLTTSGSTGLPKIVPISAGAIDRFSAWAAGAFGIGPGTNVLNYAPLNFDLCLLDVWTTLAHGGRVVLVDPDQAMSGRHLLATLERHDVHVVQAVPMFHRLVTDAAREHGVTALPAVRHAMTTGDALPGPVLAELPGLFPNARLHNIYGCTETNDSFAHEITDAQAESGAPLPLGRPLPGADALVVTDRGEVLEGPGSGELWVTTPFQTDGYLGAAAARTVFVPHPAGADDRRWYRTGDLVRRSADGVLTLAGRTDFQVKVRGVRINVQEVEHVLLAHPDISEAAVLALPDPVAGRLLHAVARRTPGSALNSLTLRGYLARGLPRAAIPSALRFTDEPLPRTSTGKVDRDRVVKDHFTKEN